MDSSVWKDVTKEVTVSVNKDSMVVMTSPFVSSAWTKWKRRQSSPNQQENTGECQARIDAMVVVRPCLGFRALIVKVYSDKGKRMHAKMMREGQSQFTCMRRCCGQLIVNFKLREYVSEKIQWHSKGASRLGVIVKLSTA